MGQTLSSIRTKRQGPIGQQSAINFRSDALGARGGPRQEMSGSYIIRKDKGRVRQDPWCAVCGEVKRIDNEDVRNIHANARQIVASVPARTETLLVDLPTEIVLMIGKSLSPVSVAACRMASRHLRNVLAPGWKSHGIMKRRRSLGGDVWASWLKNKMRC